MDLVKHPAPEGISEQLPSVDAGYAELITLMRQVCNDREG